MSRDSVELLRGSGGKEPIFHHPIKSMELLPSVAVVIFLFVFVTFAVLASGLALLRVPTSLAIIGVFLLTVLADLALIRWWYRNSGTIAFTSNELIITPRTGPTLRRTLDDIQSIQRHYARRRVTNAAVVVENYVRIVSHGHIPLQFLWDIPLNPKRTSDPDRFVANLQTRLPNVPVHIINDQWLEEINVEHARRNSVQSHLGALLFTVVMCGAAGAIINTLIPRSSGSAITALQRFERSVNSARSTALPGEDSTVARSISCFGPTGDSYWEEDFFTLQIRKVEIGLAVMSDPKTAEGRARKLLPKNWEVYGSDYLPDGVGNATLVIKTPCLTAKKGQFYPRLEARFTSAIEKLRTKVDEP
jgi:hypothetical protein